MMLHVGQEAMNKQRGGMLWINAVKGGVCPTLSSLPPARPRMQMKAGKVHAFTDRFVSPVV